MKMKSERDLQRQKNEYGPLGYIADFFSRWFAKIICLMKTYSEPDDDHSGIILPDGTTREVYLGNDGNYYWIDEDGNRTLLDKETLAASTWTNINQLHFKTTEHCFGIIADSTTLEQVQMYRFEALNKDNKVMFVSYEVIDSTSSAYTVGQKFDSLPSGLVAKDCYLPDMQQRTVVHVPLRSYLMTDGNTITVTGEELFDHKLNLISGRYHIIDVDSPSGNYAVGKTITHSNLNGATVTKTVL